VEHTKSPLVTTATNNLYCTIKKVDTSKKLIQIFNKAGTSIFQAFKRHSFDVSASIERLKDAM